MRFADPLELVGRRYGKLTVLCFIEVRNKNAYWRCRCKCGNEVIVSRCNLIRKHTRSCGCIQIASRIKHRMCHTPEHRSWSSMIQRCQNEKSRSFKNYGGRGIRVCKRWQVFTAFLSDMGRRPSIRHSLERKNNNKGYYPRNCVWADKLAQSRNKRTNVMITAFGKTQCAVDWCREYKINQDTLRYRLLRMSPEKALTRKLWSKGVY